MQSNKPSSQFIAGSVSIDDLLTGLKSGKVPISRKFAGWAKDSKIPDCVSFSPSSSCDLWFDIPKEAIENVEVVGSAPCEDHVHAEVSISFVTDNSFVDTICQLLSHFYWSSNSIGPVESPQSKLDCDYYNRMCRKYGGEWCNIVRRACGSKVQ